MKRFSKFVLLMTLSLGTVVSAWGQAPSTEGRDFWVTFLQAQTNSPELILTISAKEGCDVVIENTNVGYREARTVSDNSSTQITISNRSACYSDASEQAKYTALHVTATKDISLFAANYITKTFDAANILPTAALQDDYIVQTFPPSDHDGDSDSRGSHFAIVATEDNTVVDYVLPAGTKTNGGKTGAQATATLSRGQVWYVWTGKGAGESADLSGTTIKARDGKKIAVFQGCPHTNIPYMVEDRDHIFSQAMPTAYWGSEFGITSSCNHRRDIIAVMAINDGTQVYINNEDGDKILVHTFDFSVDKKHYWTFELGEYVAYSTSDKSPVYPEGKLPEPLIVDSSCYLTTSCPAGVHLFMVSNRYDNATPSSKSLSDPAMLWISPIEQVIKEINFSTYNKGTTLHFLNIVTTTSNVQYMTLDGTDIQDKFQLMRGNSDYSYARFAITSGNHNLKGKLGFLAHAYGYGERESYAYSCGSSTIQRSITFNDEPLAIDAISDKRFCVGDDIEMKLNIGNNDYESVVWDYGDGITYSSEVDATSDEKKVSHHTYSVPGWYDFTATAVYVNSCTGQKHSEVMGLSFFVGRADTVRHAKAECKPEDYDGPMMETDTVDFDCDSVVITGKIYSKESSYSYEYTAKDSFVIDGTVYVKPYQEVTWRIPNAQNCDSIITCKLTVIACLNMSIPTSGNRFCWGENYDLPYNYVKGNIGETHFLCNGKDYIVVPNDSVIPLPTDSLRPGVYQATITVEDTICKDTLSFPFDLTVLYPADIFAIKFNNVLAVYKQGSKNNPDYEFVGYQWYCNDKPIEGATKSNYHQDAPFQVGDSYYVVLTDKNGMTLASCSQEIVAVDDYTPQPNKVQKKLVNNRIYIVVDDRMYDMYGQRVK